MPLLPAASATFVTSIIASILIPWQKYVIVLFRWCHDCLPTVLCFSLWRDRIMKDHKYVLPFWPTAISAHQELTFVYFLQNAVWGRPGHFLKRPIIIKDFTYQSIRQTLVGDCSFVSSLAVCAGWEHRFQRALISRNIFPQDSNHVPVVSPSGKYIVKLVGDQCNVTCL